MSVSGVANLFKKSDFAFLFLYLVAEFLNRGDCKVWGENEEAKYTKVTRPPKIQVGNDEPQK